MAIDIQSAPTQPDIAYQPDFEKYNARMNRRLETENLSKELPEGFPKQLVSPLVWHGSDFKSEDEWTYVLTRADLEDMKQALDKFKALNAPIGRVCQETFPLTTFGKQLRELSGELHNGKGFFVLRGFPVESLSREDCIICYTGVSSYVGSMRGWQDQNKLGLVHIKDLSALQAVGTATFTNEKQVFHTDNGDIVSLLALEVAPVGGWSKISSSWQVYNEMAKRRPDLIRTLSEPWPHDSFGGNPAYYSRPLIYQTSEQRMLIQYFRRIFTGFGSLPRPKSIPPISEAQAEALDALQFYSEECGRSFEFRKGDIQYINNLSIFHARDGWTDSKDQVRHLLRLWLRDEEYGWQIPSALQSGQGRSWDSLHYARTCDDMKFTLNPIVKREN